MLGYQILLIKYHLTNFWRKNMILSNLITAKVNLLAGMTIGVGLAILANKIKKQNICNKEKENKTNE